MFHAMRNKKRFLIAAASLLVTLAHGQKLPPEVLESVKSMALARAALDVCLVSPDFRKLAEATQRQTVAIRSRIERLANQMHDSPKGRLLFVSYTITVSKYAHSADFRRQLLERRNGACAFESIAELDATSKHTERTIKMHL